MEYENSIHGDVIENKISKYLDNMTIAKFRLASNLNRKSMEKQFLIESKRKEIIWKRLRSSCLREEIYDRDIDGYPYFRYSLPSEIPKPKLPYGVPDIDSDGNLLEENIQSNNKWHLLSDMLVSTIPYRDQGTEEENDIDIWNLEYQSEQEFFDLIRPYIEDIFKHGLIKSDSEYLRSLIWTYHDPKKLIELTTNFKDLNTKIREIIYT